MDLCSSKMMGMVESVVGIAGMGRAKEDTTMKAPEHLLKRSAALRKAINEFLDDCDEALRDARYAGMSEENIVIDFLNRHPKQEFDRWAIRKGIEEEGGPSPNVENISTVLSTLKSKGRVRHLARGAWTSLK